MTYKKKQELKSPFNRPEIVNQGRYDHAPNKTVPQSMIKVNERTNHQNSMSTDRKLRDGVSPRSSSIRHSKEPQKAGADSIPKKPLLHSKKQTQMSMLQSYLDSNKIN